MMANEPGGGVAEEKLRTMDRKKTKPIHTFCSNSSNHTCIYIYIYDQIQQKEVVISIKQQRWSKEITNQPSFYYSLIYVYHDQIK